MSEMTREKNCALTSVTLTGQGFTWHCLQFKLKFLLHSLLLNEWKTLLVFILPEPETGSVSFETAHEHPKSHFTTGRSRSWFNHPGIKKRKEQGERERERENQRYKSIWCTQLTWYKTYSHLLIGLKVHFLSLTHSLSLSLSLSLPLYVTHPLHLALLQPGSFLAPKNRMSNWSCI